MPRADESLKFRPRTPAGKAFRQNANDALAFIKVSFKSLQATAREFRSFADATTPESLVAAVVDERIRESKEVVRFWHVARTWSNVIWVTLTEAYLHDVLVWAAAREASLMARSEQSISYADVASSRGIGEVKAQLMSRWARNFVDDGGPTTWSEKLPKMGARRLPEEQVDLLETLWAIRNLIVHQAGIVTRDFVKKHPNLHASPGTALVIDPASALDYWDAVRVFAQTVDDFLSSRVRAKQKAARRATT